MKYCYIFFYLFCLSIISLHAQESLFNYNEDNSFSININLAEKIYKSNQDISIEESIKLGENTYPFIIKKSQFSDYETEFKTNHKTSYHSNHGLYLTGDIPSIKKSIFSLSLIDHNVFGFVEIDNEAYTIHKLAENRYILSYIDKNKNPLGDYCNNSLLEENALFEEELINLYNRVESTKKQNSHDHKLSTKRTVRVAIDCDFELFELLQSDSITVAHYVLGLWSTVHAIYSRDANVHIAIPYLNVWTVQDPYTGGNADLLLNQFKAYWLANNPYDDRSVASLLSGNIGRGGLAWLGKLCNEFYGYSFMSLYGNYDYPSFDYYWDLHVSTHELGHNIGLLHTHNCLWEPPIDSCYDAENGDCFTQTKPANGTIMSYCHLKSGSSMSLHFHDRCLPIIQASVNQALCTPMSSTPSLSIRKSYITCSNKGVMIGGEATGGTPPYQYEWVKGSYISIHDTNYTVVSPKQTTEYVLRARDANNFEVFDTTTVNVTPAPVAQIIGSLQVCEDQFNSFYAPLNDDHTFLWEVDGAENNYPDTSNYVELKWSEPGTKIIKVVVRQRDGECVDSVTKKVEVNVLGMEEIQGTSSLCQFTSADFTTPSNSDLIYFWRAINAQKVNMVGNQFTARFDTLGTATIRLIAENKTTGCIDSTDFEVIVEPQPVAIIEADSIVCEYSDIVITTPMPEYEVTNTWSISNGEIIEQNDSTLILTTGKRGILIVGLKSENSSKTCSDSTNISISVFKPTAPEIQGIEGDICLNELIEVYTVPREEYNFHWSANVATIHYQNEEKCGVSFVETGTHQIRLILEHKLSGCTDTSYADVTVLPGPAIPEVEGNFKVCKGSEYQYKTELNNSVKYKWIAHGGSIIGEDNKFTVDVKWTDENPELEFIVENPGTGCQSIKPFEIEYYPEPSFDITGVFYVCDYEKQYEYKLQTEAGHDFEIDVTGGNILSRTDLTIVVKWLQEADFHSINIEFEDSKYGCSYSYQYPISSNASEIYSIVGQETLCYGENNTYNLNIGENIDHIDWYLDNIEIGNSTSQELMITKNSLLEAKITFDNSCETVISKNLYLNPNSGSITITGPNVSCVDCKELYLIHTEPADFDYEYQIEGGYIYTEFANKLEVIWTEPEGGKLTINSLFEDGTCSASDEIIVSIGNNPILDFELAEEICNNDTIWLNTGNLNYNILWKSEKGIIENPKSHSSFVYWNTSGKDKITLIKTSKDGQFKDSLSKNVEVKDTPPIPSITLENSNTAKSSACSKSCTIQWYFEDVQISDANGQTLMLSEEGNYRVEHIYDNGCSSISEPYFFKNTGIENSIESEIMIMPNPNSGSFTLKSDIIIKEIDIYNSIGELVFSDAYETHSKECSISNAKFITGMYYISINKGKYKTTFLVKK